MGFIIDIIIILTMILFIYIGYRKGLIKVAISFLSVIISIIIALILYKPIASQIMASTQLDENISNAIYSKIENIDFQNISEEEKNNNGIIKFAEDYINEAISNSVENTGRYISDSLSITIVEILTFILLVIILRLLLIVLNLLGDVVGNLPIIKQFNKSGGIIYGIIEGFVIINVILAILYVANPIISNGQIEENIQKSNLGKIIYENNFITNTIIK